MDGLDAMPITAWMPSRVLLRPVLIMFGPVSRMTLAGPASTVYCSVAAAACKRKVDPAVYCSAAATCKRKVDPAVYCSAAAACKRKVDPAAC